MQNLEETIASEGVELQRRFSLQQEFPTESHRFLHDASHEQTGRKTEGNGPPTQSIRRPVAEEEAPRRPPPPVLPLPTSADIIP